MTNCYCECENELSKNNDRLEGIVCAEKMENRQKANTRKTTSTQFLVLVREMEANIDLARGAPVFGASKASFDDQWRKVADKVNSHGPPQRSASEWRKIFADLKCRTKKKIAENAQNLNATGGGPFRHSPLTEVEETVDRILQMTKGAAPSGVIFGVSTPSSSAISDCNVASDQNIFSEVIAASPTPDITGQSGILPSQWEPVTPGRRQRQTATGRTFHSRIEESAKIQADAAKIQADASQKLAEATENIAEALKELVLISKRNTEALEAIAKTLTK